VLASPVLVVPGSPVLVLPELAAPVVPVLPLELSPDSSGRSGKGWSSGRSSRGASPVLVVSRA